MSSKKENNENNNLIKQFSKNFAKSYQSLKISVINDKKEINKLQPKKTKKKKRIDSSKNIDKSLLNSLLEFNFMSSTPQQRKAKSPKNKKVMNQNKKEKSLKLISSKEKNSKKKYDQILSSYKKVQTTTVQSPKYLDEKNKNWINIGSKLSDKSKDNSYLIAKKNCYQNMEIDPFYVRMNKYQKDKDIYVTNIRAKSQAKENSDFLGYPKILKYSLSLIENKYNKNALYQPYQMKEKNIEKNFNYFYNKILKENKSCSFFRTSLRFSQEKFNNFYERKMKWKNEVEKKINNNKLKNEQKLEQIMNKITFKPSLNRHSLKMMEQINNEKECLENKNSKINDSIKNEKNKRKSMDKYKVKIKNIINHFYVDNPNYTNYNINKKKHLMKRNNTCKSLLSRNNKLFYDKEKAKNIRNNFLNLKAKIQRKEINKKDINDNFNNINKYTYIIRKKKKIKKKASKNQNICKLYKINVDSGCAWMNQSFNQINFDSRYKKLIQSSLL